MAERQTNNPTIVGKPEIAAQKKAIKFPPAIGDWTTYKPPQVLAKRIKTGLYGFDRLSKEELNLVMLIHYRFTQQLLKNFKIDLSMGVELYNVQAEQTTYLNFLRVLSGPMVQAKLSIPNLHDAVSVFFTLNLANTIINYSLGSRDLEPLNRALTDAENIALAATITEYLPAYTAAFENVIEKPLSSIISSPDITMDPSINTSSTFVCFSAEMALGDNLPGKIFIGYQGSALKIILAKYKRKISQSPLDFSKLPPALLSKILISLKVCLGETVLTTNELNFLETGDVVNLETPINAALSLSLGELLKLPCQPGVKEKKSAVRLAAFYEAGELEIAPPSLVEEPPKKEEEIVTEEIPEEEEEEEPFEEEETFAEEEEEFSEEFPEEEFPEEEI